jgi:hypothetical protein
MFRHIRWQIILGLGLTIASVLLYLTQIGIFHDPHETFFLLFQDLAFLPMEVLLVTLILHEILSARDKLAKLKKIYMIIGIFFSETGIELLRELAGFDRAGDELRGSLILKENWTKAEFSEADKIIRRHESKIEFPKKDLLTVHKLLNSRRDIILNLMQNSYLLEHESFTDLLFAVFHVNDELSARTALDQLSENDYKHLQGDIQRVYVLLTTEWLVYMKHLKDNYPYLYSLALRTNPFDPNASAAFK